MDKNKLIETLKNKELSEKLMEDESFKKELKEILKDDVPNVTDEQLKEFLSNLENTLSKELSDDKFLENVSGGIDGKKLLKKVVRGGIKSSIMIGGGVLTVKSDISKELLSAERELGITAKNITLTRINNMVLGGINFYASNRLGDFICDKLGL